jgi:hypothetical protein
MFISTILLSQSLEELQLFPQRNLKWDAFVPQSQAHFLPDDCDDVSELCCHFLYPKLALETFAG